VTEYSKVNPSLTMIDLNQKNFLKYRAKVLKLFIMYGCNQFIGFNHIRLHNLFRYLIILTFIIHETFLIIL
jgi:hypothetical protein